MKKNNKEKVINYLMEHGRATTNDLMKAIGDFPHVARVILWRLKKEGKAHVVDTRKCPLSGKTANIWSLIQ